MTTPALALALTLASALAGQCRPDATPLGRYAVNYDGLTLTVEGSMLMNGNVRWDTNRPFNASALAAAREARAHNFGLATDKIGVHRDSYTADTAEARKYVSVARSPHDQAPLHVTVVGSDEDRAAVVNDLRSHPAFASLRDHILVQDYRPDEWAVDPSLGFPRGKPSILVQAARGPGDPKGGRVLYRASDYDSGPDGLAEAIRKADPDYDPGADPGPATGRPAGTDLARWEIAVAGVTAVLFVVLLPRKKG